jgi:hypothetical protein
MTTRAVVLIFQNAYGGERRETRWRAQDITVDGVYMELVDVPRTVIAYFDTSEGYWTTTDDKRTWTGFTFA